MFGDLPQWLALMIMLVPGFIVTSVQRGFSPKKFPTQFDWIVSSILHGIFLNALVLAGLVLFYVKDFSITLCEVRTQLPAFKVEWVLWYFAVLYFLAVVFGFVFGNWPQLQLRSILNRMEITRFSEHSSVWDRIFDKWVPENRKAIWVKSRLDDGSVIFGRLRHSSANVFQDKPIELYVSPYFELTPNGLGKTALPSGGPTSDGIYLKLTNEQYVQFFFKSDAWEPSQDDASGLISQ